MLRWFHRRGSKAFLPSLRRSCSPSFSQNRTAHTKGVYVHHTSGLPSQGSIAATLGLFHALQSSRPGLGFFVPIESSSETRSRSRIIKEAFGLKSNLESMHGITQDRAFELYELDKVDDVLEEVFRAYEAYRVNHDFVVVEGTSLKRGGDDATLLNSRIASTFGLPVIMVTNVRKVAGVGERRIVRWDQLEWERDIALSAQVSASVMKRNFVDVLGSIIYRLPATKQGEAVLRKHFEDLKIPYLGAIPEDGVLKSIKVDDIVGALGADVLYGTHSALARSRDCSQFIAATSQLSDVLSQIKSMKGLSESVVVITDAGRPDILLGLMDVHQSESYPHVSAIVVAGGKPLQGEVELLVKERPPEKLPPIILSSETSFETAATLADLEGHIFPDSQKKIDRAKVLFDSNVNVNRINDALAQDRDLPINPKVFQHNIFSRAKEAMQKIVLPEGDEPRTVQAAGILLRQGICHLIMLGNLKKIEDLAKEFQVDLSRAKMVDPSSSPDLPKYAEILYNARKHKGMTYDEAQKIVKNDVSYFGTCMVAAGHADGMVSGAIHTTADTVRPALQIIKTDPGLKIASSVFFMCLQGKVLVFGDCAINADPTSEELAAIAIAAAKTADSFGVKPRVALLSYATGDSNTGPMIQKVADAADIAKRLQPDLPIDGPLQYDAAVNPETARIKLKGKISPVAGKATVLIFPDLNTGNTTYKAVQQSTGAIAMGPVIQGLKRPVNDLSRGCTVDDIVSTVAITAVQAGSRKEKRQLGEMASAAGG